MANKILSFFKRFILFIIKAILIVLPLFIAVILLAGGISIVYVGTGIILYYVLFGNIKRKISRSRILLNSASGNSFVSETGVVSAIGDQTDFNNQDIFPAVFPREEINIKVYRDADEPLDSYKTFEFDYTNKENPLLEKELFRQLEKVLHSRGLKRAEKNPQITISMGFFIGKKEQYIPPTTVTSTELKSVWNYGMIGWTPGGFASSVPVTTSQTIPGYTAVSYYSNIRLNFLNHAKLAKGAKLEIPPLIWLGEADSEGQESDIRGIAPVMFNELIGEFPKQSTKSSKRYICRCRYGGLGLGFDTADWRVIRYIEPGSVAAEYGIKPGDVLIKINGERTIINWADKRARYLNKPRLYRSKDPYFQYILSNHGNEEVELTIRSAETRKTTTIKIKPRNENEGRYIYIDTRPFKKIANAVNPIGILFVIISTAIIIYYFFIK